MRKTHLAIGLAAVAAATVLSLTTAHAVSNPPGSGGGGIDYGNSLHQGDTLYAGDYISRYDVGGTHVLSLTMQADGNLVEYISIDPSGEGPWQACWASGTYGSGADHAAYQSDGNFVVYNSSHTPMWASNTQWGGGTTVDMNADGVIYVGTKPISNACHYTQ